MRVSLRWLQELVQLDPSDLEADQLAERLSVAGFEVESIEDLAANARGVVVGRVISREPHPGADKLSVCQVDVGAGDPLQIVCGAANVRADIHVPVAVVGVGVVHHITSGPGAGVEVHLKKCCLDIHHWGLLLVTV